MTDAPATRKKRKPGALAAETADRTTFNVELKGEELALLLPLKEQLGDSWPAFMRNAAVSYHRIKQRAVEDLMNGSTAKLMQVEERLAASLEAVHRELASLRRAQHAQLALLDTFVKLYLGHTPQLSPAQLEEAAKEVRLTDEQKKRVQAVVAARFEKYIRTAAAQFDGQAAAILERLENEVLERLANDPDALMAHLDAPRKG